MLEYLAFVLATPFVGGLIHFLLKDINIMTHIFNSLAGGIILGAGLMHSMPDAIEGMNNDVYPISYLLMGSTILFLYSIQIFTPYISNKLLLINNIENSNNIIKLSSYWSSLLIHGVFEGFSTGTLLLSGGSTTTMVALFIHKTIEYSALGTRIIKISNNNKIYWGLILSANVPCVVCFCVSSWYAKNYDNVSGVFASLTSGTFLYLSLSHIIPETLETNNCCLEEKIYQNPVNEIELKQIENCENCENCEKCESKDDTKLDIINQPQKITIVYKTVGFVFICIGFAIFGLLALVKD